jgi:hypothetical protein
VMMPYHNKSVGYCEPYERGSDSAGSVQFLSHFRFGLSGGRIGLRQ